MPLTVVKELQHPRTPVVVRTWIGTPPAWLDIRNTNVESTGTPLGVGELAAITLAEQLDADLVLMDDLDGRLEAERRHPKVIGTLGVLTFHSLRHYRASQWMKHGMPIQEVQGYLGHKSIQTRWGRTIDLAGAKALIWKNAGGGT